MTWEHIFGESQGGHLKQIHNAVAQRFQGLPDNELQRIAREIEAANTVTCCRLCNSTTSRDKAPLAMQDLIAMAAGGPEEVVAAVRAELEEILNAKKRCVSWKLASVKKAFEEQVAPKLNAVRQQVFMKTEHAL